MEIDHYTISSTLVSFSSVIYSGIGLSSLVYKIHKTKHVEDLTYGYVYGNAFCTFSLLYYGLVRDDPYLYGPEGYGAILSIIIIFQKWYYTTKK